MLLVLLRKRDRELTAELEALLEQTGDRGNRIFAAVAAGARELAADVRVDPDVKLLISIVRALREVRRARARASADAGGQTRAAGTGD